MSIDASGNPIGTLGAHMLASVLPRCSKLTALLLNDAARGPDLAAGLSEGGSADGSGEAPHHAPKSASPSQAAGAHSFGVLILEGLLASTDESSSPLALTEVGLGLNPAVAPPLLVTTCERFLRTARSLHTLHMAGSSAFRLKGELPSLLGAIAASAASGGARLVYCDVSAHHASE